MSLRTRLVVAFLLLAVVPLGGLTVYSYVSSERAVRRAVEAEADSLARDMSGQLGGVTLDIRRRIGELGDLSLAEVAAGRQPDSQRVAADLQRQMGPVADLLESLEFIPTPAAPSVPPVPPPAPAPANSREAPAPPDPAAGEAGADDEAASAAVGFRFEPPEPPDPAAGADPQRRWVVRVQQFDKKRLQEEIARATEEIERQLAALGRTTGGPDGRRQVDEVARAVERRALAFAHEQARLAAAQAKAASEAAEVERERRKATRAEAEAERGRQRADAEQARAQAERERKRHQAERLRAERLAVPLSHEGRSLGTVRASVRADRLLDDVLARTQRRRGEVPFAVDAEGRLHAAPADLDVLTGQAKLPARGVTLPLPRSTGDWVLASERDAASGLTLGIARPLEEPLRQIRRATLINLAWGLGLVALATVGIVPVSRRITRDLERLTAGAERLSRGDLDARVPVRSRDELGRLAATFNRMAGELRAHQDRLLEQERIHKELEMGRRIQREMLPHAPLQAPFAAVAGVSVPAREVGGDFFNYFLLPDGDAALLVGDVSGKGVGAALLMANVQAQLRARLPNERDLSLLAARLDREIERDTPLGAYLTLFLAVVAKPEGAADGRGRLRYVNGGQNPPFVLHADGRTEALEPSGRPLGLLPGGGYETREVALESGDCLFLYTDGVVECENATGEPFGTDRLQRLLVEERASGLDGILTRVEEAVRAFREGREAEDDATMVVLRFGPGEPGVPSAGTGRGPREG